MTTRVPPEPSLSGIEEDHASVRASLAEIGAAKTSSDLRAALGPLPQQLRRHFAREESQKGFFDDVRTRKPGLSSQLERFQKQHSVLLEQVDELCRSLEDRSEGDSPDDAIPSRTQQTLTHWLEMLRTHEREEAAVINDVYYTDEGGHG